MRKDLFILLLLCPLLSLAANEALTIGLLPGGDPQMIEKESYILAEKLQNRLGRPVQIYISKNYTAMIEALKNKRVDLAILSSMTYVTAEKQIDLKVLLKKTWNNGPFYYSSLLTRSGSGIKSVKDLKNKKIAFVDEKSTSGYLYPQVYLRKNAISDKSFKSVEFTGNHAASVELLEAGKVDVIAVFADDEKAKLGAWTRFGKTGKLKPIVIWTSDPIPNDPIVVRQEFYDANPKLTHELMYDLIEIQSEANSGLSEILGTSDLMPATSRQYDPVREMVKIFQSVIKI